ncbi:MAG: hypothetical protein QGG73_01455 [Candidatus Hydrogenedentes bacterium]|jgi:hypothetical protein|nr:hypothetical protein [Candidatus Hydrogenedentota bacterium]
MEEKPDLDNDGGYIPTIVSTIWLKPFDLGVSQQMDILLPLDPETEEFKAQIVLTRLSGTREAWLRLNKSFVALVRRHFLHWRAVSDEERTEMFHKAKQLMDASVLPDFRQTG